MKYVVVKEDWFTTTK